MDYLKLYTEAIEQKYKAQAMIDSIQQDIKSWIRNGFYKKFEGKYFYINKYQYQIFHVKVLGDLESQSNYMKIAMFWVINNPLSKRRKEKLDKIKNDLKTQGYTDNSYKIDKILLIKIFFQSISNEEALKGFIIKNPEGCELTEIDRLDPSFIDQQKQIIDKANKAFQ